MLDTALTLFSLLVWRARIALGNAARLLFPTGCVAGVDADVSMIQRNPLEEPSGPAREALVAPRSAHASGAG